MGGARFSKMLPGKSNKRPLSPKDDAREIKKWSPTKGSNQFALIINVKHDRAGAKKDDIDINELLTFCNFNIMNCLDLSREGIKKAIIEFKQKLENHKGKIDSCIIAVMAHGRVNTDEFFVPEKGRDLHLYTDIIDSFNRKNCPPLDNVPKAYLINICRGDQQDKGITTDSAPDPSWFSKFDNIFATDGTTLSGSTWTDTLICYASYYQCVAYRDTDNGAIYIQTFCKAAKEYLEDKPTDIERIIRHVNLEVPKIKIYLKVPEMNVKEPKMKQIGPFYQTPVLKIVGYNSENPLILGAIMESTTTLNPQKLDDEKPTAVDDSKITTPETVKVDKLMSLFCEDDYFNRNWESLAQTIFDIPEPEFHSGSKKIKCDVDGGLRTAVRGWILNWKSRNGKDANIGYLIKKLENYNKDNNGLLMELLEQLQDGYNKKTLVERK